MKVVAVLPAYNAKRTLKDFVKKLPQKLFSEIILVDDCSHDRTFELAKKIKGLRVYQTPRNMGYGGNLKMGLSIGLEKGADVLVEIHPDGEYDSSSISEALKKVKKGAYLVLGNRFDPQLNVIQSGMFWWKYPFLRILNVIENFLLGTNIPDLHQGFRVYSKDLLNKVNFRTNSDGYLFSFEIITQAVNKKMKIDSVPVRTFYSGKKRGASFRSSVIYSLGTFKIIMILFLRRLGIDNRLFYKGSNRPLSCSICQHKYWTYRLYSCGKFEIIFCSLCQNGFLHPVPANLSKYYSQSYWESGGPVGQLKDFVFDLSQRRRASWIQKYLRQGSILDVGAGEMSWVKALSPASPAGRSKFRTKGIDHPKAQIKNKNVLRKEFLSFQTSAKYDAIVFWESLEHVPDPASYLQKALKLLKPTGALFIEYPRFDSSERKVFGPNWFHLDPPRHLWLTNQRHTIKLLQL